MRVLQVITDTDRRGAQVFAVDLHAALTALGHQVETVALATGTRSQQLEVRVLGARSRGLSTLRCLRKAMRGVDITIAHGSSTLLASGLAGLGPGRPFVYRQISDSRFWARSWPRRARVSLYLRFPQRIVALSPAAADTLQQYLHVREDRIDIVPNGVPVKDFLPASSVDQVRCREMLGLPGGVTVALYVGALVPEKGAAVAVEALGVLPDVHLAVAGDGSGMEALVRLAEATAPGRVHFLGDLNNALPAYQASDVVLLPSLGGDSMPATLIEAGFCRLPSISTPVGSIADIVLDGQTGLLTSPGDASGLADAIRRLQDVEFRAALGAAAEAHCRARFEIGVVATGWEVSLKRALRPG